MRDIVIVGGGGFGREVEMLIGQINASKPTWKILGYLDDAVPVGNPIGNSICLGRMDKIQEYPNIQLVLAVGSPATKASLFLKLSVKKEYYPTLIHPSVLLGNRVAIGDGCIICAGNIVTEDITIADFTTVNLSCTIGHDTRIGPYTSIMPGVTISGDANIASSCYLGTGCTIINQVEIGENTIVGAGAVVSKSLPPNCTAVGIPAKPIKFHS
jgi:sugar O-acyltransferase (sialic acid O-acetyltransferase NeuD family)